MAKMWLFMMTTLDGYFEGPDHDISWHNTDEEFGKFAVEQMQDVGTIVMGRKTYQLMESYWPTDEALIDESETAQSMNILPKIVYSRSLQKVVETDRWKNVTLRREVDADEILNLKQGSKDIAVLGSSNLSVTLLEQGFLDELRVMINPVLLGKGSIFLDGIQTKNNLKLISVRQFGNGNILLTYQPI
jgi:dihydrofolate reductase